MTEQETPPSGFSEEEEEWLKEQRARKNRRNKRAGKRDEGEGSVNINSLMDIMVILLVFLLKSYGEQPIRATGSDLKVPEAATKLAPEDMLAVTVTRSAILVNDKKVTDVPVDKSQKRGGESGFEIIDLLDTLSEIIEVQKRQAVQMGDTFEPMVTIVADRSTRYRLLTEVMYTAGQAGLSKFKFAVIQSDRSRLAPSAVLSED